MPFWLKPTWCTFLPSWIRFVFQPGGAFPKMAAMAFLRRFRYTGATLGAVASQMDRYKVRCMERSDEREASPFKSLGSTVRRARFVTTKPFADADAEGAEPTSDIPEEDLFGSPVQLPTPRSPSVASSGFGKSPTAPKDKASPLGRTSPLDRLVENRRLIGLTLGCSPQADGSACLARQMASPPQKVVTDLVANACARRCISPLRNPVCTAPCAWTTGHNHPSCACTTHISDRLATPVSDFAPRRSFSSVLQATLERGFSPEAARELWSAGHRAAEDIRALQPSAFLGLQKADPSTIVASRVPLRGDHPVIKPPHGDPARSYWRRSPLNRGVRRRSRTSKS